MKLLEKVKHLNFIIQDKFQLDEIVRKYGKTSDQKEEYISGVKNENNVQIKRSFKLVKNIARPRRYVSSCKGWFAQNCILCPQTNSFTRQTKPPVIIVKNKSVAQ
ncbi:hypothetical protein [Flavobacterium sp. 7A]|uniref:hypothetical protein n=1 Tax=Flavobacterium sp. 7A TaxID=2940571 RepID=UPI002226EEC1|nr:hypothetical protein [Flavobacterium sp. 7A]MCW2118242.1 hypothetical protein [Flavobacterium sp. 7A]